MPTFVVVVVVVVVDDDLLLLLDDDDDDDDDDDALTGLLSVRQKWMKPSRTLLANRMVAKAQ